MFITLLTSTSSPGCRSAGRAFPAQPGRFDAPIAEGHGDVQVSDAVQVPRLHLHDERFLLPHHRDGKPTAPPVVPTRASGMALQRAGPPSRGLFTIISD